MKVVTRKRLRRLARYAAIFAGVVVAGVFAFPRGSFEDPFSRVGAGRWVTTSVYWEDLVTANAEKFFPLGLTAAHKTLPFGTLVRVSSQKTGQSITVRINDRGPFIQGRELDLSVAAAALIGFTGVGDLYMEILSVSPQPRGTELRASLVDYRPQTRAVRP